MKKDSPQDTGLKLPWWTWILPFFLFFTGTLLSIVFKYGPGSSFLYIPTVLGIILINWWGLRILPALYLNAVFSCWLWDLADWTFWPLYALPETLFVFLSWYIFTIRMKGKFWMPDIENTLRFIIFGLLIPLLIYIPLLKLILMLNGHIESSQWIRISSISLLGEFTGLISLGFPVMVLVTPYMHRKKLVFLNPIPIYGPASWRNLRKNEKTELILTGVLLLAVSMILSFENSWFILGIISLYVAIRFGFYHLLVANLIILFLNYFLPAVIHYIVKANWTTDDFIMLINLGLSLLFVFAIITGRVISDLRSAKNRIDRQMMDLQQANTELDSFVYSASHDLSAPLKSILGLIHILRLETDQKRKEEYLLLMEKSINKLNLFIREILDYSRNSRLDIERSSISLDSLIDEVLEDLKYLDNLRKITVIKDHLDGGQITTDRLRLKIILSNFLSNAIKFHDLQKENPYIKIQAFQKTELTIRVEDNGPGIPPELHQRIFQMFYRGSLNSTGSGLGLYIARETALKLNGHIEITSKPGEGSVFSLILPIQDTL